ncbi:hypothetical protein HK104_005321 [Borealophlyctis nickersoniae]|nr:hypothetical protein HK104_005321 [Borealophlyctis nickersoniae]
MNDSLLIKKSIGFYVSASLIVIAVVSPWVKARIGTDPLLWTLEFLLFKGGPTRIILGLYWATAVAVAVAYAVKSLAPRKDPGSGAVLNLKRKYFHALATVMFAPGYVYDPDFMHLAFSVSLSALILVEYIRHFRVWPFGPYLQDFLTRFLDARDRGPVILSHLYLLVGCAGPVWLNSIINVNEKTALAGLSGVLTLGIGDALVGAFTVKPG